MKKIFFLLSVVLILVVLLGTDIRREKETVARVPAGEKISCKGYTIIEFGKGINCDGDTVKLVKVKGGGQELLANRPVTDGSPHAGSRVSH